MSNRVEGEIFFENTQIYLVMSRHPEQERHWLEEAAELMAGMEAEMRASPLPMGPRSPRSLQEVQAAKERRPTEVLEVGS